MSKLDAPPDTLSAEQRRAITRIRQSLEASERAIIGDLADRIEVVIETQLRTFTASDKAKFVESLFEHHNVHRACVLTGISRRAALTARTKDPLFAMAWDEALQSHVDAIEDHVIEQAKSSGTPLWAIFALKSHRPDVYGDQVTVRSESNHSLHVHLHAPGDEAEQPRTLDVTPEVPRIEAAQPLDSPPKAPRIQGNSDD